MKVNGSYFCRFVIRKFKKKTFTAAGTAQNHRMGHIAVMQVQEVRGAVVGFEHGQVLLPQLAIAGVAGMQGKEERQMA